MRRKCIKVYIRFESAGLLPWTFMHIVSRPRIFYRGMKRCKIASEIVLKNVYKMFDTGEINFLPIFEISLRKIGSLIATGTLVLQILSAD